MWKTIPFESEYEVSTNGEVRNKVTRRIKSLRLNKGGYLRVTLYPSGKTYSIHRLVAETYLIKDEKDTQVNHIDGNKLNNKVSNLEWCTAKENFHHAVNTGLYIRKDISGYKNPMARFTEKDIVFIKNSISLGYKVNEIAKILAVPYERVRRVAVKQHYK